MIDAVRARVKQYGGDAEAVAETLYEMAAQSDLQDELADNEAVATGIFESLFEEELHFADEREPQPNNGEEGDLHFDQPAV